ncbi:hypothetical protein IW254_001631 [Corynebacterium aquatimens]|uniref:Transposase n=1 Tax=Corynebacterium aquatimens TaxID=1190508 RepID=A0A931E2D7_9CORY|nr:hypothetical protein [Corynebacterium aquatimens]
MIFLDALRVKIRDGHRVVNKACYMAVGVDMDGIKHILGRHPQHQSSTSPQSPTRCSSAQPTTTTPQRRANQP